jgi:hypothetical protein
MKRFVSLLAVAVLAAGCSGSGRPATYPVSGTVTMNGKPLDGAQVVFVPASKNAEAATGVSDAAGRYQLTTYVAGDGAQSGEFRVRVLKYDTKKPTREEQEKYITLEEEQKIVFAQDEKPIPPAKNLLPKKYESEITSGLKHTVPKSASTFDIPLE